MRTATHLGSDGGHRSQSNDRRDGEKNSYCQNARRQPAKARSPVAISSFTVCASVVVSVNSAKPAISSLPRCCDLAKLSVPYWVLRETFCLL